MKKRAVSLSITLVLVLAMLLTACSSGTSSKPTSTPSDKTSKSTKSIAEQRKQLKGTLNIWMRKGEGEGGKPGDPFYDYIHSQFPNLVLNISPDKDWKDITKGLASGDLPDIFFWEGPVPSILKTITKDGYAEPLDSYLDKDPKLKNSFIPSLLESHKVDGATYGIPFDVMPVAVVANLDLFDQANVPYPTNDWTISDFNNDAKALTNKSDPQNMRTGLARNIDVEDYPRMLNFYLQGYGVNGYKEVNGKKVSNLAEDPKAITAIQNYLQTYGNNYATTLSDAQKKAMGLDTSIWDVDWEKGIAGMFVASSWAVPYDQTAKSYPFKVGVYNVPKGPNGRNTLVDEIGYSIYKGSKNKDLAWQFLKFMTSQEFRDNAYTTDPDTGGKVYPFKYDVNRYAFSTQYGKEIFGYGIPPFTTQYKLNDEFKTLYDGFNEAAKNTNNSYVTPDLLKLTQDVNSGKKQLVDALKEYDNKVNASHVLDNPPSW
ncbi:MAG: extracellular solute-binding protein [Bacillota bacterium]|nr:extracellular solute-binding protein [Bacillota bacterium]